MSRQSVDVLKTNCNNPKTYFFSRSIVFGIYPNRISETYLFLNIVCFASVRPLYLANIFSKHIFSLDETYFTYVKLETYMVLLLLFFPFSHATKSGSKKTREKAIWETWHRSFKF